MAPAEGEGSPSFAPLAAGDRRRPTSKKYHFIVNPEAAFGEVFADRTMSSLLAVVLLLAAALSRAAADYLMTSIYSDSTCSSTISPNRRSFSFAGGSCALISPGVWGGVSCVNPSVANQVLFSDAQCTAPFPPQPVADLVCARLLVTACLQIAHA
jgi:hypothetical protein